MVQMGAVRDKGRLPPSQSADDDRQRIQYGQPKQQDRHHGAAAIIGVLSDDDSEHRDTEAEKLTARVAHEQARRKGIETQEAENRAEQGSEFDQHRGVAGTVGKQQQAAHREQCDAARQAVETVGQVHGVGDAHQHEHRERQRHQRRELAARQEGHALNEHAAKHGDDQRREHLPQQLEPIIQVETVVKHAEHGQQRGSGQKGAKIGPQRHPDEHRHQKADEDSDAANARDATAVHLASTARVQQTQRTGDAHQRRNQRHDQKQR